MSKKPWIGSDEAIVSGSGNGFYITPEVLKKYAEKKYGSDIGIVGDRGHDFVQAITNEGDNINALTAGAIITSEQPLEDDNTIQLIQSFYENRRG